MRLWHRAFCGLSLGLLTQLAAAEQSLSAALAAVTDASLRHCLQAQIDQNHWTTTEHVRKLQCHSLGIRSAAGLSVFSGLHSISLHNNDLQAFDPSLWPELQTLNLAKNKLTYFQAENLTQLTTLYLFGNQLQTLTLNNLPKLNQLKANSNRMTAFTYQQLKQLKKIYLFDNDLDTFDITRLPAMDYLDVRQNPMPDELYEEMDRVKTATILHDGNAEDWH